MSAPNEIKPAQLLRLIGTPDAPHIIDVTTDEDFAEDPYLIPGAKRLPHTDIGAIIDTIGDAHAVVICQKGKKLSQGVAAWLRSAGKTAEYLQGGNYGWRDMAQAPRVPISAMPAKQNGATLWVTRHRPKIDRIACPWLIRRFIDRNARFLFVAPADVIGVAARFDATPFDVDGVFFSHAGDKCTFDRMVETFGLTIEPLEKMAHIIRAADTGTLSNAPEAAGLLALSIGLSRQYRDDTEQLEAGLALYDALFRWARDGQNETHGSRMEASA